MFASKIPVKSVDFSANLPLKIPRNFAFFFAKYQKPCIRKNRPISRDFRGKKVKNRSKIGRFRGRKVKICRKIGRFREILAEKSQISKDFRGKFLEKSADFTGNFWGKLRQETISKKQPILLDFFGKFR